MVISVEFFFHFSMFFLPRFIIFSCYLVPPLPVYYDERASYCAYVVCRNLNARQYSGHGNIGVGAILGSRQYSDHGYLARSIGWNKLCGLNVP